MHTKITYCKCIADPTGVKDEMKNLRTEYFDFAMLSLGSYSHSVDSSISLIPSDRLESAQWGCIVGEISQKYGLAADTSGSCNEGNFVWGDEIQEQFDWALHLGVNCIVLPELTSFASPNFAKCALHLASSLTGGFQSQQLLVPVPFVMSLSSSGRGAEGPVTDRAPFLCRDRDDSVLVWNTFKHLTGHHCRLHCLLDLSMHNFMDCFVSDADADADISAEKQFRQACRRLRVYTERWGAEQLRGIALSTHLFHANDAGFPVLPREYQLVVALLLRFCNLVCFKGSPSIRGSFTPYMQYVNHLQTTGTSIIEACCDDPVACESLSGSGQSDAESDSRKKARVGAEEQEAFSEAFTAGYRDTLQMPLQPLGDNLENCTYETFERDPTKYEKYEEAAARGLVHMAALRGGGPVRVAVVGAGRGPLVACVLRASARVGIKVAVFAVEKNKNAVLTLHARKQKEDWANVSIVKSDMRVWVPASGSNTIDILVSELLGSWGDNELSPECLDHCIVRCLSVKKTLVAGGSSGGDGSPVYDGISIPASYTSFMVPLSTSRLWMSARDVTIPGSTSKNATGLDTPFVVKLHHCHYLSPTPQSVFTFSHPPPRVPLTGDGALVSETDIHANASNRRYQHLSFTIAQGCGNTTIHGFAGTFESELFEGVMLSIKPDTHTPGMFSWFPLFLPLASPLLVRAGDVVAVHLWRCVDEHRVWYEWCLSSPVASPVQNSNGASYAIRLS